MKQYSIVSLLTPGTTSQFTPSEFPLHLTLAGPFYSDKSLEELVEKLRQVCSTTSALTLQGTTRRMFGRNKDIPGTILGRSPELYTLHNNLFDALKGMVTIKIPEHNRAAYNPHVCDRPTGKILPAQKFMLETISLIEYKEDSVAIVTTELIHQQRDEKV